ncbi:hypothetical protein ACRW9N_11120 [Listeria aquatica]
MKNSDLGGFIVSNNVLDGVPVRYTFRKASSIPQANGWNIYSIEDDGGVY